MVLTERVIFLSLASLSPSVVYFYFFSYADLIFVAVRHLAEL